MGLTMQGPPQPDEASLGSDDSGYLTPSGETSGELVGARPPGWAKAVGRPPSSTPERTAPTASSPSRGSTRDGREAWTPSARDSPLDGVRRWWTSPGGSSYAPASPEPSPVASPTRGGGELAFPDSPHASLEAPTSEESDRDAIGLLMQRTGASPTSLMRRLEAASRRIFSRGSRGRHFPLAEVRVPVALRDGTRRAITLPESAQISVLLDSYTAATGAQRSTAELHVLERPPEPGADGLTRALADVADGVRHPRRIAWAFQDAASWILLPPLLAREAKGRGALAWLHRRTAPHLREAAARLRVSLLDVRGEDGGALSAAPGDVPILVRVYLCNDRRIMLSLRERETLRDLRETASLRAAVPRGRQLLVLREGRTRGPLEVSLVALLATLLAILFALIDSALRMLGVLDPEGLRRHTLAVRTQSGRLATFEVRHDATLRDIVDATRAATGERVDGGPLLVLSGSGAGREGFVGPAAAAPLPAALPPARAPKVTR